MEALEQVENCSVRESELDCEAANMELFKTRDKNKEFLFNTSKFLEYDPKQDELDMEIGFDDPSNPPVPGCNKYYLQWRTRRFVEHFVIRVFTLLCIVCDMIILIIDLANNQITPDDPLEYCSLAFSTYFLVEVTLRLFGLGKTFFMFWYNCLDLILVVFTFVLSILTICVENMEANPASLLVTLRLIRLVRISRIVWERRTLSKGVRQLISQNKRRYQQDGFDLDLTYVSPRVIAMSFPSRGGMSIYRNDIREVARFLDSKHPGKYKVYNLCSERFYDDRRFHGTVERYMIDDHNVPSLEEMLQFSKSVKDWFAEDDKNVIAVHCKGGKGRTGTMICVVLIDTGVFKDAEQSLSHFGDRRTDLNVGSKFQGVETPSQSRYVQYYERITKNGMTLPLAISLIITKIRIEEISGIGRGDGSDLVIQANSRCHQAFEVSLANASQCQVQFFQSEAAIDVTFVNPTIVNGDTKVKFISHNRKIPRGYENCPFFLWFHTSFIENLRLELGRCEVDNPHKSKTWHVFKENFKIVIYFKNL